MLGAMACARPLSDELPPAKRRRPVEDALRGSALAALLRECACIAEGAEAPEAPPLLLLLAPPPAPPPPPPMLNWSMEALDG